ncbi:MAG: hypothetical protein M1815_002540 [Lichina confinis]|nr:MAG: hypothetical protein M1815_002540 [Lichina confinis]
MSVAAASSPGVNVFRYSALALGVFYGVYHQRKLTTRQHAEKVDRELAHRESLIERAKAEYARKTDPRHANSQSSGMDHSPSA